MSNQAIQEQINKHKRLIGENKKRLNDITMGDMLMCLAKLNQDIDKEEIADKEKFGSARRTELSEKIEYSKTVIMLFRNFIGVRNKGFCKIMYNRLCEKSTDIIEALAEQMECKCSETNENEYMDICNMFKDEMVFWDRVYMTM